MKTSFFVIDGMVIQRTDEVTANYLVPSLIVSPQLAPSDPSFDRQWHLNNVGSRRIPPGPDINVQDVWDDYTGDGIIVGVVDDGVEYTHPDLAPNYDTSLDLDEENNDNNAAPGPGDNHGTAVAGVIGAAANGLYGVGVAYDSTIVGLRMGFDAGDGPDQPGTLYDHAVTVGIDILNNSWGYNGFFQNSDDINNSFFSPIFDGLENLVENGRGGLGSVVFFSSGNSGDQGQDANYHNILNSRYTITVGSMDRAGDVSVFSNPGAPVFVVLPGEAISTTDRVGAFGYTSSDKVFIDGTSFSSPIGAGIAALMLEANPNLGWRDVQEIFALSAIQIDETNPAWTVNGASNWNGGGLHTSRYHGFGLTDTLAAVRLAETWTLQSTSANETFVSNSSSPSATISDLGTVIDTITIPTGVEIDHVLVTLSISHTAPVDLVVTLISPDGTESQLVVQPGLIPGSDTTPNSGAAGDDGIPDANIFFTVSSTEFWGETGEGTWTLVVEDTLAGDSGTLNSWTIELYGDALTDDDTYFFTDEYATFAAADTSRQTITDTAGINAINAAAVTSNVVIDLSGAGASTIALTPLNLGAGSLFHNAFAGDGDDTIIGNALGNLMFGGRGDDNLTGGSGTDTVMYLSNSTEFTFTIITASQIQISYTGTAGIDEGTDLVTGVEFYQFGDTTLTKNEVIVLAGGAIGLEFTSGTTATFAEESTGTVYDADATLDGGSAPTYAITGGADAALFNINTTTGEVTFDSPPDFEVPGDSGANNVYDIDITASADGVSSTQTVQITVTNVNDNAPTFTSGTTASFAEAGSGTAYIAAATDVDGETPTFSISGGADAADFNINSLTGEVTFISPPDYEIPGDVGGDRTYNIDITASDGVNTATQSVAISVTDVSGPPIFTSGLTADFAENGTGTAYDTSAASPDGPAPTYSITGGSDASLFSINTVTGEVTFDAPPDFESPGDDGGNNDYDIEITAESDGLQSTQTVTINVTNANDLAPVFTSGTAATYAENGFGPAYDADATDGDGNIPTFTISGGADSALFNINSATGEVTFILSPDFESPSDAGGNNVYDIEVTANDGVNQTAQSIAIEVTNVVNEFNVINGTSGDDELLGTGGADQINGLEGADRITGGPGIDQLNGGGGDDVFLVAAGDGPDTYNGGTGTDTIASIEADVGISFAGGIFGPSNSIELITNDAPGVPGAFTVLTGTLGNDTLDASTESTPYYIQGLDGRDTMIGGSADDVLEGGSSRDVQTGNSGADTFVYSDGDGSDRLEDFDPNSGDVVNLAGVGGLNSFTDVQANLSTVSAGTKLTIPGGGSIIFVGLTPNQLTADDFEFGPAPSPSSTSIEQNAAVTNTTIDGTAGADNFDFSATDLVGISAISMGDGNDVVTGSSGADTINGEADADTIDGGAGNDVIDGGQGSDTAVFSANLADYTPTQIDGDSVSIVGPDGTDTVHSVENFQFDDQTLSFADLLGIVAVPTFTSGTTSAFAENATGTAYDADAFDLDSAAPTFAISGGADASLFTINTITGEVSFVSSPDYETPTDNDGNNIYEIDIKASSNGDDTIQSVSISVTNENDNSPVITSVAAVDFPENGNGIAYDADGTDNDGDALTFSISGGADASLFSINTATGEVSFLAPPDFETPGDVGANNTYDIDVSVTDGSTSATLSVAISVTDVDENAPSFTLLTGTSGNDTLDASAEVTPYYIQGLDGRDTMLGGSDDDVLEGGSSRDVQTGNGGADTFVYSDGDGSDRLEDFDPNSGDVVNLAGVSGLNSFADVQASLSTVKAGTKLTIPGGGSIIFVGLAPNQLAADDFEFGPAPSPTAAPAAIASTGSDSFIWSGFESPVLSSLPGDGIAKESFSGNLDLGLLDGFAAIEWGGQDGFVWNAIELGSVDSPVIQQTTDFKDSAMVVDDLLRQQPAESVSDDPLVSSLPHLDDQIDDAVSQALGSLNLGDFDQFII